MRVYVHVHAYTNHLRKKCKSKWWHGWHEAGNWEIGGWDMRSLHFTIYCFVHFDFGFINIYYSKIIFCK